MHYDLPTGPEFSYSGPTGLEDTYGRENSGDQDYSYDYPLVKHIVETEKAVLKAANDSCNSILIKSFPGARECGG